MLCLVSKHDISLQNKMVQILHQSLQPCPLLGDFETPPIGGTLPCLDCELAHMIYFKQWQSLPLQTELQLNTSEHTWAQTTARNQALDQQLEGVSCVESQLTYRHTNKNKWPFQFLSATDFGDNCYIIKLTNVNF